MGNIFSKKRLSRYSVFMNVRVKKEARYFFYDKSKIRDQAVKIARRFQSPVDSFARFLAYLELSLDGIGKFKPTGDSMEDKCTSWCNNPDAAIPKMKILCLHGNNSSADIFIQQTKGFRERLGNHHEYMTMNGLYQNATSPGTRSYHDRKKQRLMRI